MIKYINKKVLSLAMAGVTLVSTATFTSCGKKNNVEDEKNSVSASFDLEEEMVDSTMNKIKELDVNINEDIVAKDSALLLLLSELAKEDENGKISSETMAHFKNVINEENMIDNYDVLLNKIENSMLDDKFISIASVLPESLSIEKRILSHIENIALNAINNKNDKRIVLDSFDKMYTLFVEEKRVDDFEVRDLPYSLRSAASAYAREVNYLARYYASEQKRSELDERTNDQNAKVYMINILGKVSNQMAEESLDKELVERFNLMYTAFNNQINSIIKSSSESNKELVNYINLEYLTSEEVSTKDRNTLVGEYDEVKVRNTFDLIDAITKYNSNEFSKNNDKASIFGLEKLLINGKEQDAIALKFIQSNSYMLLDSINENVTYEDLMTNPYFDNLTKYITKLEDNGTKNFVHTYKETNGEVITQVISYQNISDGVHFVCDEIVRYTLDLVKSYKNIKNNEVFGTYYDQAIRNSINSIQYLQNTIYGECEKVDAKEYFK